jgi:hypothetical protein
LLTILHKIWGPICSAARQNGSGYEMIKCSRRLGGRLCLPLHVSSECVSHLCDHTQFQLP